MASNPRQPIFNTLTGRDVQKILLLLLSPDFLHHTRANSIKFQKSQVAMNQFLKIIKFANISLYIVNRKNYTRNFRVSKLKISL